MAETVKFSSKIEKHVLDDLRRYAEESKKNISVVLNEAVAEYVAKVRLRPAFMDAATSVIEENRDLLKKLAE